LLDEEGKGMAGEPSGWAVEEYVTAGGKNLMLEFLKGLIGEPKAETIALIRLLKERGNLLRMLRGKRVRMKQLKREVGTMDAEAARGP
jgi:hypothetical protein